jgi:predicted O-methyltransferase YrrM
MSKVFELGHNEIDVLFIDGDHSVNQVVKEWAGYVPYLSNNGVVIFHDTTVHPGPAVVYDAIDEAYFDKRRYFADRIDDWGVAVARRRNASI